MRHVLSFVLGSSLAVAVAVTTATSASAASPPIKITKIYFDSPGADHGSNASLNAEYVRITNTTSKSRSITGWTLKDKQGFTYRFPTFTLKAKASVDVHTGKGRASATHRHYNRTWYVWNNTGDTAYLRDSKGVVKDKVTFKANRSGYLTR